MEKKDHLKERIIVALDVENREQALALASELSEAQIFKVGLELFAAEGPSLLREIQLLGKKIFLDLKLHDIPNTVAEAAKAGARHGARMMTIHASGGEEMMARAVDAVASEAEKSHRARPLLLGVTILTSLKNEDLASIGMTAATSEQVLRLAGLAQKAGMDGIVSSAHEIEILRKELGRKLIIVTPGIRPTWATVHDQKRIMTPALALQKGADYLVVGRPITRASSPREAFQKILQELEGAVDSSDRKNRP
ncbi:MAG: orotidine-5'-phosphate decarboxylase [Candidatus Aminicenantales bacterium]